MDNDGSNTDNVDDNDNNNCDFNNNKLIILQKACFLGIAPFGRFPFDQKFRKSRVEERMEQTFSGISLRNFGSTSRG